MLKILVVDDEPRVRRGISSLIEEYSDKYELAAVNRLQMQLSFLPGKFRMWWLQISKCPIWMDWN